MRKSTVYNLRGNARTAGVQRQKEGGTVFDAGSRATVAITILVKDPAKTGAATIHYTDIGDYLSRDDKLRAVATAGAISSLEAVAIAPNQHGDWLNQRREDFGRFDVLGGADGVIGAYSMGVVTNRDTWVYGSSKTAVLASLTRISEAYANSVAEGTRILDSAQMSWSAALEREFERRKPPPPVHSSNLRVAMYRPFFKQHLYFTKFWNQQVSETLRAAFPTPQHTNVGLYLVGSGSAVPFAVLMLDSIPDLHVTGAGSGGQFFARWRYEKVEPGYGMLAFDDGSGDEVSDGYHRIDNITDDALGHFRAAYGPSISKDDIFYYVYGLLHSPDYRETYAADLKKMLPRIPLVADAQPFIDAGRKLSELHLGYETVTPYPLAGLDAPAPTGDAAYEHSRVERMGFAKVRDPETKKLVTDRSIIVYNSRITLTGIPEEAYRFMLGSRSAIEWIIDRYQIKTDKASGIVNDPNDWSREVSDPRYIIDLLARIVTVSLETMKVVDALPALDIRADQA